MVQWLIRSPLLALTDSGAFEIRATTTTKLEEWLWYERQPADLRSSTLVVAAEFGTKDERRLALGTSDLDTQSHVSPKARTLGR